MFVKKTFLLLLEYSYYEHDIHTISIEFLKFLMLLTIMIVSCVIIKGGFRYNSKWKMNLFLLAVVPFFLYYTLKYDSLKELYSLGIVNLFPNVDAITKNREEGKSVNNTVNLRFSKGTCSRTLI